MTSPLLAAALAAALSSAAPDPVKPAAPAPAAAKAGKAPLAKPSKAALADARGALLGPCSRETAGGTVKTISVIDGKAMNAVIDAEKLGQEKADPAALFLVVEYAAGPASGKDYRQISTIHHLSTEQAQVLVGEKLCVFGKAP